jgi:Protein of unknown function (DUF2975)
MLDATKGNNMLPKIKLLFRICNWLNWGGCAIYVAGVVLLSLSPDKFLASLGRMMSPGGAEITLETMQGIAILIIPTTYAAHRIFKAIGQIIDTAIQGEPFVVSNAALLRIIGWALLAIQFLDLIAGYLVMRFSDATGEYWGWSLAVTGWLAALLMFVLARIFEHGAQLRDDLEGTV